jgi:hypothetical protein
MGEIAVIAVSDDAHWPVGREVEILSPLRRCGCRPFCPLLVHVIGYDDGGEVYAPPHCLRKRRPPQDWKKLCNLTDVPKELCHV